VHNCELTISVFRETDKYTVYYLLRRMRMRKLAYGRIKTRELHFVKINMRIIRLNSTYTVIVLSLKRFHAPSYESSQDDVR
jgi:hypothetical protein